MTDRQFLWGLSGGVMVMAIAGVFWFGLGLASVPMARTDWRVMALSMCLQVGACVGLLWAAFRLRRRSGFNRSDFRNPDERQRAENRRIRVWFAWTGAGQAVLIALGVWWCVHMKVEDRIWPWIGLIVSLHLIPLARLFRVRTYYAAGFAGPSSRSRRSPDSRGLTRWLFSSGGLAGVMWLAAPHVILNTDRITSRAMREPRAV